MRKQRERKREKERVSSEENKRPERLLQSCTSAGWKNRLERCEIRKQRESQVGYGAAKCAPVHGSLARSLAPEQPGCQTRY